MKGTTTGLSKLIIHLLKGPAAWIPLWPMIKGLLWICFMFSPPKGTRNIYLYPEKHTQVWFQVCSRVLFETRDGGRATEASLWVESTVSWGTDLGTFWVMAIYGGEQV